MTDGRLDADPMIAWLGGLIERICSSSPALVGFVLDGVITARFAGARVDRVSRLVLVDTLGLAPLDSAPGFGLACTTSRRNRRSAPTTFCGGTAPRIWLHGSKTGG